MTTANTNDAKERESLAEQQEEAVGTAPAGAEAADVNEQPETSEQAPQEAAAGDTDNRIVELETKITALTQQAEDNHNRFLRAQADFDNFRRRTQREKEELSQYASMKLIEQLLPVLDNFERALLVAGDGEAKDSFQVGMEMIHRQLFQVLEAEGLRKMEAVGEPFDPEMHQAVMREESDEHEEGIVLEAIQNGYWLKEKVLRPAMVKVSG